MNLFVQGGGREGCWGYARWDTGGPFKQTLFTVSARVKRKHVRTPTINRISHAQAVCTQSSNRYNPWEGEERGLGGNLNGPEKGQPITISGVEWMRTLTQ